MAFMAWHLCPVTVGLLIWVLESFVYYSLAAQCKSIFSMDRLPHTLRYALWRLGIFVYRADLDSRARLSSRLGSWLRRRRAARLGYRRIGVSRRTGDACLLHLRWDRSPGWTSCAFTWHGGREGEYECGVRVFINIILLKLLRL